MDQNIVFFIGNGVQLYKDRIQEYCKDKARFSTRSHFIAYEVGLLGYELIKNKRGVNSLKIEPFYLRKSQAEEKS